MRASKTSLSSEAILKEHKGPVFKFFTRNFQDYIDLFEKNMHWIPENSFDLRGWEGREFHPPRDGAPSFSLPFVAAPFGIGILLAGGFLEMWRRRIVRQSETVRSEMAVAMKRWRLGEWEKVGDGFGGEEWRGGERMMECRGKDAVVLQSRPLPQGAYQLMSHSPLLSSPDTASAN